MHEQKKPDLEVWPRGSEPLAAQKPYVYMFRIIKGLCMMIRTGTLHLDRFAKMCLVLTVASAQTH